MEADLIFHNVGQGLFYSGQIRCDNSSNFNFVYDCGATEKRWNDRSVTLDTCIDRYTKYLDGQDIDMLVISHFHHDHINGIVELLKIKKVKDVVIPFYTYEERLVSYFVDVVEEISNEELELVNNPYEFFLAKDVKRIIVVRHQENDGMDNQNATSLDELQNNIPDSPEYSELRDPDRNRDNKIFVITDNNPIKKACWNFAFYADNKFKDKFDQKKAKKGITDLKNAKTKKDRENAIAHIKASYDLKSNQMNETSLIMVHKFDDSRLMDIYAHPIISRHRYWHFEKCHYLWREKYKTHILTGDFNFQTTKWDSVKKHFGSFINSEILVMQIAHHGSIDNWDKNISSEKHPSLFVFLMEQKIHMDIHQ